MLCSAGPQYLGFSNIACSSGDSKPAGLSAGPVLKPSFNEAGPWKWGQWSLSGVKRDTKGTYRAVIFNQYDKKLDKPLCLGSLAVANLALCKTGVKASQVQLRRENPQGKNPWASSPGLLIPSNHIDAIRKFN